MAYVSDNEAIIGNRKKYCIDRGKDWRHPDLQHIGFNGSMREFRDAIYGRQDCEGYSKRRARIVSRNVSKNFLDLLQSCSGVPYLHAPLKR